MGMHEHDFSNITIEVLKEELEKAKNHKQTKLPATLRMWLEMVAIILGCGVVSSVVPFILQLIFG